MRGPAPLGQPDVPEGWWPGPLGAGATGRTAGLAPPDPRSSLRDWASSPILESPSTPAKLSSLALSHLRAQASSLFPNQMPQFFVFVVFFASDGGLAKASKMRVWNASGKGMGLYPGRASLATNAPWELAQDQGPNLGRAKPNPPVRKM